MVKKNVKHSAFGKIITRLFFYGLLIAAAIALVLASWQGISWLFASSYVPGKALFTSCQGAFTSIKATPSYGIVFNVADDVVENIQITTPGSANSLNTLTLEGKDWIAVYFSNNFSFSQIQELIHLSKLEKNSIDYCYLIEQISLTTGVPMEYIIVNDPAAGISSTLSLRNIQQVLAQIDAGQTTILKHTLLPLFVLDDGSKVPVITYSAVREQIPNFFKIDEVAQEQAFVEVYNVTNIDGYASIISRKWAMLGIDISRVGNAQHPAANDANAIIYVKDPEQFKRTIAMIKSSFPPGKVVITSGRPTNVVTTGDIVVFLLKR